ncbi:sphingosine-1-phosphate phosphatase 2-like [Ornithodoros turicata]|uniref:sphingosine-1-phosphate phosphatase 2-like n=1 Tax=Ornithodoros turicata TaxID=34597 RepID=UPI00313A0F3B
MDDHLKTLLDIIERLKSPYLVEKVQNYFGVYRTAEENGGGDHAGSSNLQPSERKVPTHRNGTYRRRKGDAGKSSSEDETQTDSSDNEPSVRCRVDNKFWFYFFHFGSLLGYEMFYASFFPFWLWNIDSAVCRRVLYVWGIVMYFGGAAKDIIRWPRPRSPPVVQFDKCYSAEYGMPSTHAITGASVPFGLLIFTMHRYEYPVIIGLLICTAWCALLCISRLYLGMHTILDIIGGLVLASGIMAVLIPFAETFDEFLLRHPWAPWVIVGTAALLTYAYPSLDHWTPARGDTCIVLATIAGIFVGSWLNFKQGYIHGPGSPPPYQISWPGYTVVGLALLRSCIGILSSVATRAFFKSVIYAFLRCFLRVDTSEEKVRKKALVELPTKFITYLAMGLTMSYLSPVAFRFLNIERETIFTEV